MSEVPLQNCVSFKGNPRLVPESQIQEPAAAVQGCFFFFFFITLKPRVE